MTINGLVFRLKQICYVKGAFKRVSCYLDNGTYCLQENMRSVINKKDSQIYSQYFREEPKKGAVGIMVKALNMVGFFRNRENLTEQSFSYGALYIANNNDPIRELKLLDTTHGTVMIIFADTHEKASYLKLYHALHDLYRMPKIHYGIEKDNALVISLVRKMDGLSDLDAVKNICNAHIRQLKSNSFCCSDLELKMQSKECSKEAQGLIERLSACVSREVSGEKYTICLQHGDLSADNLMYGESEHIVDCWWIDWEHVGLRVFFYDVFFFILNNAVADSDFAPTKNFLSGYYDDDLERLFLAAGHKYVRTNREDYFLLFVIAFIKERLSEERLRGAVEQYQLYIEDYFM